VHRHGVDLILEELGQLTRAVRIVPVLEGGRARSKAGAAIKILLTVHAMLRMDR
jgi:hypothetical protein